MTDQSHSRTLSPYVAAGIGALAGMYSCGLTLTRLSMFFAPLLGIVMALLVFKLLTVVGLPSTRADRGISQRSSTIAPGRERSPWVAGSVAFAVCVAFTSGIAYAVKQDFPPGTPESEYPLIQVGVMLGALIGLPTGLGVAFLARRKRGTRHGAE